MLGKPTESQGMAGEGNGGVEMDNKTEKEAAEKKKRSYRTRGKVAVLVLGVGFLVWYILTQVW